MDFPWVRIFNLRSQFPDFLLCQPCGSSPPPCASKRPIAHTFWLLLPPKMARWEEAVVGLIRPHSPFPGPAKGDEGIMERRVARAQRHKGEKPLQHGFELWSRLSASVNWTHTVTHF